MALPRYRTQEVAGSSPASSIEQNCCKLRVGRPSGSRASCRLIYLRATKERDRDRKARSLAQITPVEEASPAGVTSPSAVARTD